MMSNTKHYEQGFPGEFTVLIAVFINRRKCEI